MVQFDLNFSLKGSGFFISSDEGNEVPTHTIVSSEQGPMLSSGRHPPSLYAHSFHLAMDAHVACLAGMLHIHYQDIPK